MNNDSYEIPSRPALVGRIGVSLIAIVLCAALTAIGLSALGGYQAGLAEQRLVATQTAEIEADIQFALGLTDLEQRRYELAIERFRYVLGVYPDYPGAAERLAEAEALLNQPTPTSVVPPSNTENPAELLAQARTYFGNQEWEAAIARLRELQGLDSTYQPASVQEMLYESLVNLGLIYVRGDRLEEGILLLEQAAAIRPLGDQAEGERWLASLYLTGRNYWGIDWGIVISNLTLVYDQAPSYRDVAARLQEAHVSYADLYMAQTEYCPAEEHYAEALQIASEATIEQRWQAARDGCAEATPIPQSISGALANSTPQPIPGFTGRLAYTAFDAERRFHTLFIFDSTGVVAYMAAGGSQPSWRGDGGALVYHGLFGTQGVYVAYTTEPFTPLLVGEANYPSFSPDGTQIAYSRLEGSTWRLYTISSTCDQTPQGCQPEPIGYGRAPIWGSGGVLAYNGCDAGGCGVMVMTPGAGNETRLTSGLNDLPHSWSPDSDRIAFMSDTGGDWEVYTVDLGGNVVALTDNSANDGLPAWSPDGATIAFMTDREGDWAIYLTNIDGTNPRKALDLGPEHPNWANERISWGP